MSHNSRASIFKYLPKEEYAQALIEKGQLRFSTLAFFRAFEDGSVRGDPDDGKLQYKPEGGLTITKQGGEVFQLDRRFRASVKANDIFVYCMSNQLSEKLAERFESPFCAEIKHPIGFIGRIRRSVRMRSRLDHANVHFGPVDYRTLDIQPGADWALPEKVAFIKPEAFVWQNEYRVVLGNKGAFGVENVELALESEGAINGPSEADHNPLVFNVGDLSKITELYRF